MQQDRTVSIPMASHPGDFVHQATPTILETFPAGGPRGSWPADEFAADLTAAGTPATVVMNLATDTFDVVKAGA